MTKKRQRVLKMKEVRKATGLPLPAAKLVAKNAGGFFDFFGLAEGLERLLPVGSFRQVGSKFNLESRLVGTCGEGTCQYFETHVSGPRGSFVLHN